jgi:hypothetical protein
MRGPICWICGKPAGWVVGGDWLCFECKEKYYSTPEPVTETPPPTRRKRKKPVQEVVK